MHDFGGDLNERAFLECPGIDRKMLKWVIKGQDIRIWDWFICLRIGTSGGLLRTLY